VGVEDAVAMRPGGAAQNSGDGFAVETVGNLSPARSMNVGRKSGRQIMASLGSYTSDSLIYVSCLHPS